MQIVGRVNVGDKLFLKWLLNRLVNHYGEPTNIDYVGKLASIVKATPEDQLTPNTAMIAEIEEMTK